MTAGAEHLKSKISKDKTCIMGLADINMNHQGIKDSEHCQFLRRIRGGGTGADRRDPTVTVTI